MSVLPRILGIYSLKLTQGKFIAKIKGHARFLSTYLNKMKRIFNKRKILSCLHPLFVYKLYSFPADDY